MSKGDLDNCDKSDRVFYLLSKDKCESAGGESCYKVPKNYHCKTYMLKSISEDDIDKPIYTKSEAEVCSGQDECITALASKSCLDGEERAYISADYSETYCSKDNGYSQKVVDKYVEDSTKKASYEAVEAAKVTASSLKASKVKDAKDLLTTLNSTTALTSAEIKTILLGLVERIENR